MLSLLIRRTVLHSRQRLRLIHSEIKDIKNEPVLEFRRGSPELAALQKALKDLQGKMEEIPCMVGGEEVWTKDVRYQVSPYDHSQKVAKYCYADKELINKAINAAVSVRRDWDLKPLRDRAEIFLKAADLISGPRRAEVLAKTMIGQAKTIVQAEIDAAAELIDFLRFNAKYALDLQNDQPISCHPSTNKMVYRGLEGFVAAVSPFNFTAIGGNLAGAPALMGGVVLWKPSDTAILSGYAVYQILLEAGLPPNVIQFVPADGPVFGDTVTSSEHLAGINFTGSVQTFKRLWKQVSENLDQYRTFPRLAGECGGKNFHFVHKSADVNSVVNATIRSVFEYGGQKCSACSRMYVPDSLWPQIKEQLIEEVKKIKVGNPVEDLSTFFSAVIDEKAFGRIRKWLQHAHSSPNLSILTGGKCDDTVGYFVEPTIIETKDPKDPIMEEEIFGPVLTVYVYPGNKYEEILHLIDATSPYGLTGAVFAQDKGVINEATRLLRNAAGNFYINDKSTGAVVAQQPFGGSRASGTNDKPGGPHYILRWTSPQAIKETHVPLTEWKYPYMS
ncbi:delta-1-pyrroline-5-carboxylate dehydrogenase, mitochondrial isoform X2 [Protopterus annectens]|uniref:delta-1-pyrroline-5-carboxylate dehydrogenase, mitochondrial isoform X2 n=1 Tax=Protopterus annectens TaxID=7888 RepID=UPI001CF95E80|nr:delta-1-pyrroline-5-carboxylate dehydrogenase, mitochondrial isoform X2 [Protopterus annectens]